MSCTEYTDYIDALSDGAIQDAFLCPYQDLIGGLFFGFLVMVFPMMAVYTRTGSIGYMVIIGLLLGGIILPQIVGIVTGALLIALMMILGIGPILVLRWMDRV